MALRSRAHGEINSAGVKWAISSGDDEAYCRVKYGIVQIQESRHQSIEAWYEVLYHRFYIDNRHDIRIKIKLSTKLSRNARITNSKSKKKSINFLYVIKLFGVPARYGNLLGGNDNLRKQ